MFSVGEVCYLFTVFEEISKIFQKININVSDANNKGHGTSVNLNKHEILISPAMAYLAFFILLPWKRQNE